MATTTTLATSSKNYTSDFHSSPSKKFVGDWFLRHLFFPLCDPPSRNRKQRLEANRVTAENFWNNTIENTKYPAAPKITELFTHETIAVPIRVNGKNLTVSVEVIETRLDPSRPPQNFHQMALGLPNLATVNTYIDGVYPFLTEYLRKQEANPDLSPARFFLISAYDTVYTNTPSPGTPHYADSLDESGLIFSRTLKELANNYNKIHFLLVHSASAFRLAYAANYGVDIDQIFVDRGASCIDELCKIYLLGKMGLMPLARWCGWDVDVGRRIVTHLSHKDGTHIIISGVKSDPRFPGSANLCEHDKIREAAGFPMIPKKQQITLLKVLSLSLGALDIFYSNPLLILTAQVGIVFGSDLPTNSEETTKTDWVAKLTFLYFKICDKTVLPKDQHIMPLNNFQERDLHESFQGQNLLHSSNPLSRALLELVISKAKSPV